MDNIFTQNINIVLFKDTLTDGRKQGLKTE